MITVVGIGSGNKGNMTFDAVKALENADCVVGYNLYIDLIKDIIKDKEFFSTGMKQETDRCQKAVDMAAEGKNVVVVSSGDAGVYGMAGLIFQLAKGKNIEINVVSGVSACLSGGAVLGAPLTSDFAVISLSDLLTPWEKIEKRLVCAAKADFVVCLYNPSSKKRFDYLKKACDIMLEFMPENTPCGYVENIGREGEKYEICTLKELREKQVNMFTTVFIGNSQTEIIDNKLVTPRGYRGV